MSKIRYSFCFKILVVIVILGLFAFGCVRIFQINTAYPSPKYHEYKMNENIKGGDITICFTSASILNYKEIMKLEPDYTIVSYDINGVVLDKSKIKMLLVELDATNTSESDQVIDMGIFSVQSGKWSTIDDPFVAKEINGESIAHLSIKAGHTRQIKLPYMLECSEFQFDQSDFDNIKSKPFDLILSTYPVSNILHLSIQ